MQFGLAYTRHVHNNVVDLRMLDFNALCRASPRVNSRHYSLTSIMNQRSISLASLVVYMVYMTPTF
jgi:hypothetical protein